MENKNRFSTLRVFKLPGSKPPPPPPKDAPGPYNITPYITPGASTSQLTFISAQASTPDLSSPNSLSAQQALRSPGMSDDSRYLSPHSPITARSASPSRSPPTTSAFKKGLTKLSQLGKKPNRSQALGPGTAPHSPSLSAPSEQYSDEGISAPWNFQHHIHVNGDLQGLPPSWSATLAGAGFTEQQIEELRARRTRDRAIGDGYATDTDVNPSNYSSIRHKHPDPMAIQYPSQSTVPSSISSSSPSPPMVVNPQPRTDSLRRQFNNNNYSITKSQVQNNASAALAMLSTPPPRPTSPASSHTSSQPAQPSPGYVPHPYTQPQSQFEYQQTYSVSSHAQSPTDSLNPSFDTHSDRPSYEDTVITSCGPSYERPDDQAPAVPTTPPIQSNHSHPHRSGALPKSSSFRVVNKGSDSSPTPSTPPPAYASSNNTGLTPNKVQRRGSMEKTGFENEAEREEGPSGVVQTDGSQLDASAESEDLLVEEPSTGADEELLEDGLEGGLGHKAEESEDGETGDSPCELPSSLPRAAALPPRLSFHTDGDDDWSNIFSFLPIAGAEGTSANKRASKRLSKRMSGLGGFVGDTGGFAAMFDKYKLGTDKQDNDRQGNGAPVGVNGTHIINGSTSTATTNGKPVVNSTNGPSSSTSISNPAIKRRSKRFSTTLAIVPPASTNYVHATITAPQQQANASALAAPKPGSLSPPTRTVPTPPSTEQFEPQVSSSPNVSPETPALDASQATQSPQMSLSPLDNPPNDPEDPDETIVMMHTSPSVDVFTPDSEYPIKESPLWEEVRTLVRETTQSSQVKERAVLRKATGANGQIQRSVSEPKPLPQLPLEDDALNAEHLAPPKSAGLYPPSPRLNSRFSDATSFQEERNSRCSEGEELGLGGVRTMESQNLTSRFSDATSFQRFSDVSSVGVGGEHTSRFSAWSTSSGQGQGHGGHHMFSPMEPMPEGPLPLSPPFPRNTTPLSRPSSLLSRRSADIPPAKPPPTDELPPIPTDAVARRLSGTRRPDSCLSRQDDRRLSGQSTVLNAQVQSAEIVTLAQASVVGSVRSNTSRSSPAAQASLTKIGRLNAPSTSSLNSLSSPVQGNNPPPLPLPPVGKVLPSMIIQQRRQQHGHAQHNNSIDSTHSVYDKYHNSSPISASSASSHSAELAEFSASFGFGYDFVDSKPLAALSAAASTFDEPLKSPELPYMRGGSAPSSPMRAAHSVTENGQKQEYKPYSHGHHDEKPGLSSAQKESGWLSDDDEDENDDLAEATARLPNALPEHEQEQGQEIDLGPSLSDSPAMYSGMDPPLTPAITVNGLEVFAVDGEDHSSGSFIGQELPLVLQPLEEYINIDYDPQDMFTDLVEVATGQYGSVYRANVVAVDGGSSDAVVAVKKVPIPVNNESPKIRQLHRELKLMSHLRHKHVLGSDGLFYDFAANMLWIRMELMTRSLADVLVLAEQGLKLDEPIIARFASDTLLALAYLNGNGIAHRDVRSDNLLINDDGVLKIADFSNAVGVSRQDPLRYDIVGVHHWQAPEVRTGCYDASKVDVWSLGATVWECAEYVPPFDDIEDMNALTNRWPPLTRAEEFSDDLHEFLRLCSEPASKRPSANQLLHNPFIDRSCPRTHIVELLSLCRTLERETQES